MHNRAQRLIALVLLCLWPTVALSGAEELSRFRWEAEIEGFGGYSGLWVAPDGVDFMTISDRGTYIKGRFERDAEGRISGVDVTEAETIRDKVGHDPESFLRDAEGLAIRSDGTIFISYESHHRIWAFETMQTKPRDIHKWNRFWHLQQNSGMEALAIDANDVIYTIPERSGRWTRPFPIYRLANGTWDERLKLPRREKFLVSGADFGPDGRLYVLEREFLWYGGFKIRVRSFVISGDTVSDERLELQTGLGDLDNMEGISVRAGPDGQIVMTLVSDDNFNMFQSTWFVEYRIVP